MDGHHLGDREGTEGQNPAYGRLTVITTRRIDARCEARRYAGASLQANQEGGR